MTANNSCSDVVYSVWLHGDYGLMYDVPECAKFRWKMFFRCGWWRYVNQLILRHWGEFGIGNKSGKMERWKSDSKDVLCACYEG